MPVSYESEVTIDRPPEVVFPYFTDRAKQALWSDVPMTPITEGELRTGSSFEVTFGMGPLKAVVGLEMSNVEAPAVMAWRTFKGPIDWTGEYRLTPEGAGTRVHQRGTLVFKGVWRLIQPMAAAEIRSGEVKELEKLKSVVESGS